MFEDIDKSVEETKFEEHQIIYDELFLTFNASFKFHKFIYGKLIENDC